MRYGHAGTYFDGGAGAEKWAIFRWGGAQCDTGMQRHTLMAGQRLRNGPYSGGAVFSPWRAAVLDS